MAQLIEIKVPDIGDFKDVPVIEILVKPGDTVEKETSLMTLETEKAAMEVPSPQAGVVKEFMSRSVTSLGRVVILMLEPAAVPGETGKQIESSEAEPARPEAEQARPQPVTGSAQARSSCAPSHSCRSTR